MSMLSDVIGAIMARWGSIGRALVFASAAGAAGGCGMLVGDVDVRLPPDAGPQIDREPLNPGCQAGAVRCQGQVLQACNADGSGWTPLQRCASAALCVDDPGEVSRCIDRTCEPGITCSGAELLQCNEDLSGFDPIQRCQSAAHCDAMNGACKDAPCVPGEISCNGATLQRCNDAQTGYEPVTTCATAALCDDLRERTCGAQGLECDATGAECAPPTCSAGQLRCTGTRLETCNAGRNGWDFVDECVTEGVCEATLSNPVALSCIEPPCDVGDVVCSSSGARLACNDQRTDYTVSISQCRSPDDCTPDGCQVDPCTVGELSCNGPTLQQCQASPSGGRPSRVALGDCATRQLCELSLTQQTSGAPACVAPSCAPGEFSCAGRQMQVCNAGRTAFANHQLCATDGLCQAGVGLGACPPACSGAACNGSMLRTCNEELTGLVDREDCGTAAQCDSVAGRCADPCVPGALRCNGAALERCQNPLLGWQRLQTCVTGGLCQLSVDQQRTTCEQPRCNAGQHRCDGQELEVCNAELTGFVVQTTCAAGQICDADNQQCDVCPAGSASCNGDVFSQCSANGQVVSTQPCRAGLCSASGPNLGCLACSAPGAFRCDNQGSLFECTSDQRQENQLDVCRTPQLCRADLGTCLKCDPPGSSRCEGAEVRTCSAQNTESPTRICASAALCEQNGATATCEQSACTAPFECTNQGEVLVCNAGQTGYVAQSPRVLCATAALCDVTAPGGCQDPACSPGERRCGSSSVVEVCNDARTAFRAESTCNTGAGFGCVESGGGAASCQCTPGALRCLAGAGLQRCNAGGSAFEDVAGDGACNGSVRVSCTGATLVENACEDAAHCEAASGAACAGCVNDGECGDGQFCTGEEACLNGTCQASAAPCAPGRFCVEAADSCVDCRNADDCAPGQTCTAGACVAEPLDGGT
jgi:hypothetical protein